MNRDDWLDYYAHKKASQEFMQHFAKLYGWNVMVQPHKPGKDSKPKRLRIRPADFEGKVPFISGKNSGNTSYYFGQFIDAMHSKLTSYRSDISAFGSKEMGIKRMFVDAQSTMASAIKRFTNYSLDTQVEASLTGPFGPASMQDLRSMKVRGSHFERLKRLGFDTSYVESAALNLCVDSKLIVDIYNVKNINRDKPSPEDEEYRTASVVVMERYRPSGKGYKYRWATGFMAHHTGFKLNRFSSVSEQAALTACKMSVRKKIDATIMGQ